MLSLKVVGLVMVSLQSNGTLTKTGLLSSKLPQVPRVNFDGSYFGLSLRPKEEGIDVVYISPWDP